MTCLPRTRAERTGLTVSIQHACLKILSFDQITLLCVFHQKCTLHRVLDPAWRGFALPVKKGAHSCGDRCVKTGCQSVARPDGYRSKTVSCRVMFVRRWQREWRYSPDPTRGLLPQRRRQAPVAGAPQPHHTGARPGIRGAKAKPPRTQIKKSEKQNTKSGSS